MSIVSPHPSGIESKTPHLATSFPGAVVWCRGWSLLSRREKRLSFFVLGMMILAAASSAVMVAAIFPVLSIIANPDVIQENERLRLIYEYAGFSSRYDFLVATGLVAAISHCRSQCDPGAEPLCHVPFLPDEGSQLEFAHAGRNSQTTLRISPATAYGQYVQDGP